MLLGTVLQEPVQTGEIQKGGSKVEFCKRFGVKYQMLGKPHANNGANSRSGAEAQN